MSVARGHSRPNLRHPQELQELLSKADAPALMQRWAKLDTDHDVPDVAGYNVAGTTRYLDRDVFQALLDPDHAKAVGVAIDTGLTPDQTIECILRHEGIEKVLLDGDNDIDSYEAAHEFATTGEHEQVRAFGGSPIRYERGLKEAIAFCAGKKLEQPPKDLACAPVLDDPDKNDKRVIKALQRRGVADAFKRSKETVGYSRSTGADRCGGCAQWQGARGATTSPCDQVEGIVRPDRWCRLFEAVSGN